MQTYVVIPTYNEADNIRALLLALPRDLKAIVVDDNSSDDTAAIAEQCGAEVIRRPSKLGVGSAVRDGLSAALRHSDCWDIITMDADFSHNPEDIPKLYNSSTQHHLIIGSRFVPGGKIVELPFWRVWLSKSANYILYLFFTHTRDNSANFRIYSRQCASMCLDIPGRNNEWLICCLIALHRYHIQAHEVPVTYVNRTRGISKLHLSYILSGLLTILKEVHYAQSR